MVGGVAGFTAVRCVLLHVCGVQRINLNSWASITPLGAPVTSELRWHYQHRCSIAEAAEPACWYMVLQHPYANSCIAWTRLRWRIGPLHAFASGFASYLWAVATPPLTFL